MSNDRFIDERRTAPAVREWASVRREQHHIDKTRVARVLHTAGLSKVEIADILGVHWAQVEQVLKGEA
jgi:hypothetical protein